MMNRHVLVGCLGPTDQVSIPTGTDEVLTRLDLVASERKLGYGLGQVLDDAVKLGLQPSEIGLDLLIIATLVQAADTRISRKMESQDTWTREIRLFIPVCDPTRWNAVSPILEKMLHFLSGDLWSFQFRKRPAEFERMVPTRPDDIEPAVFDDIALFSGGLDSLIGAIDKMEAGRASLLISHSGDGATSGAQAACFKKLQSHYKQNTLERLRVWMTFPKHLIKDVDSEDTSRGRSFLFFSIGIFAGSGCQGPFTLRVSENGLIALNVPLDPLRLGALSTRTTHPFYMGLWNELIAALEILGQVDNPYWNKTKGEMVRECANPELLYQLIPESLSCASPTKGRWKGLGIEHCGYCLPCLIRRASIDNDPTSYTVSDLTAQILDTRQAEGQQIRSFQYAIHRLQKNPALAHLLIHKPGPLRHGDKPYLDALADVYRRGMEEIATLIANVQTRPM